MPSPDLPAPAPAGAPTPAPAGAPTLESKRRHLARLLEAKAAPLPMASIQEQIWFHERLQPENRFYNVGMRLRLTGPLDVPALSRALDAIVARHAALRESFETGPAGPIVRLAPPGAVPLPSTDLGGLGPERAEAESARLAEADLLAPFDLTRPPLLRAGLARLGDGLHELRLTVHHLVFDGWSIGLLVHELAAGYDALVRGAPDPLPALAMSYMGYARAQRARLATPEMTDHLDFWRRALAGAPSHLPLPTDGTPTGPAPAGAVGSRVLDAAVAEGLERLARAEGASLFAALYAGLAMTLGQWTGEADLVLGTVVADRPTAEAEPLIGCMVNYLPLRLGWRPSDTGRALVGRAHRVALDAYAHQDCPFGLMVEALKPPRVAGRNPLYNVALLLQNFRTEPPTHLGPDVGLGITILPQPTPVLDLRFMIERLSGDWTLHLEYPEGRFTPETIAALLERFGAVLRALADSPDQPVSALTAAVPRARATVALAATFTAEPIAPALNYWLGALGLPAALRFAPFAQVFQALLDPDGPFARNADGLNVLLVNGEDWVRGDRARALPAGPDDLARAERAYEQLADALTAVTHAAPGLLVFTPPSREVAGDAALASRLAAWEARAAATLADRPGLFVVTSAALALAYPVEDYDDPHADALGRVPYTEAMYAALATVVARRLHALRTPRPKVIVVDCDETLWRGVVGEAGPDGVVIDAPAERLQAWLVEQQRAGMLIALASKNEEADVLAVLDRHPAMRLRREHLAAWCIDWRPKSENLRALAARLNVGLDSFVFLDDNPLERAEVRSGCPSVLTLELPADPADWARALAAEWAFDRGATTHEDTRRTAMAHEQASRDALLGASADFEAFLAGLGLSVAVHPVGPERLARVAQLTQRTNQFNLSTRRRTEPELARALETRALEGLAFEVTDRFGDYGLVGVALFAIDRERLVLDTFLLSCRALGRRVEWRMAESVAAIARARGCTELVAPFVPSARNQPMRDFLDAAAIAPPDPDGAGFRYALSLSPTPPAASERRAVVPAAPAPSPAVAAPRAGAFAEVLEAVVAPVAPAPSPSGAADVEAALAAAWADLLGAAPAPDDEFFAAGGHSLAAIRLLGRIRAELGVALDFGALLGHARFGALVGLVAAQRQAPPEAAIPALAEGDAGPLSFAQARFWWEQQAAPASPRLNVPVAVRLHGALDVGALEAAVRAVLARHEPLRTVVLDGPDGPRPVVLAPAAAPWSRLDWTGADEAEQARRLRALAAAPFDLAAERPVRVSLATLGPERHLLVLVAHHMAIDGVGLGLLGREAAAAYAAGRRGAPWAPAPLPCRYGAIAAAERRALAEGAFEPELAYWRERLAGAPSACSLPPDRPASAAPTEPGGVVRSRLGREVAEALAGVARGAGATPFTALLAAFMAFARRHGAGADLVVGVPVAGRHRPEAEALVGCFLNMVAVRADVDLARPFSALLADVRDAASGAYAHARAPFERVVAAVNPPRHAERPPLFQLVVAEVPAGAPALDGLEAELVPVEAGPQAYDVLLSMRQDAGGLALDWAYRADRYDAATVAGWAERFGRLVAALAAAPELAVGLAALGEAAMPAAPAIPPVGPDPITAIRAQAARTPGAVALRFGDEAWTYAALMERVEGLAARLASEGVGPEARVAIALPRGPWLVAAMLATWRAGGAYVPLEVGPPSPRVAAMLDDAEPTVILAPAEHRAAFGARGAAVVDPAAPNEEAPRAPAPVDADPAWLAYVIYTSGSTGTPKGVCVERAQVAHFLDALDRTFPLGASDTLFAVTTPTFDIALLELVWPLTRGATVAIARPEETRDGALLAGALARSGATVMQATPSTWRLLLDAGWAGAGGLTALCGGEALGRGLATAVSERVGALYNLYGPTEATVWATVERVTPGAGPVGIGRPLARMAAWVADAAGRRVPPGVAGELVLGGAGVARGYWNRPALSRERFGEGPAGRTYRTGDVAIERPDGGFTFLGREDAQVKVRGHRVELGEVESALGAHPAVRASAVLFEAGEAGLGMLVAYVEADATPEALRAYLGERLPAAMVPGVVVPVTAWPLTPNGKLDRRALRRVAPAPDSAPARPLSAAEALVAGLAAEVLGRAIGPEADFFAAGGHSLAAARLLARLKDATGAAVSMKAFYAAPTVAALARRVETAPAAPAAEPAGEGALAPTHERLRALAAQDDLASAYHLAAAVRLDGPLDAGALVAALEAVLARHDALRAPAGAGAVRADEPADGDWESALAALAEAPFDLDAGPLVRARVWRLADDWHVLGLVAHHVAADGASLGTVLPPEIAEAYAAAVAGRAPDWAPAPSYEAIARLTASRLGPARLEAATAYWRERLASAPRRLALQPDRPRPAVPSFRAGSLALALDADTSAAVRGLAGRTGTTPFVVLLAALGLYVRHVAGAEGPLIFAPVDHRPGRDAERAVGLFANILPHRPDLAGDPTFFELLARVQAGLLDDWAHQDLPYDRILAAAPGGGVGMQVMLNVLPAPRWPALGAAAVTPLPVAPRTTRLDWHVWLQDGDAGFTGAFEYAAERFEAASVRRIADAWRALVGRLVAAPDAPVGRALAALPARPRPQGPEAVLAALADARADGADGLAPPRTELERRLAAIWAEALDVDAVGRHADFFELGGHSLAAVRVLARVKAEFGRDVPLTGLFTAPTVAGLAALLEAGPTAAGPLIRLRAGGAGAPLVLAHALGGHAAAYAELARALEGDRAVYALEHPALSGAPAPEEVGALADAYLRAIAAAVPDGPLVLGGWSAGGAIAHEIACRARTLGREVTLLALIDAAPPVPHETPDSLLPLLAFARDLGAREGLAPGFTEADLAPLADSERLALVIGWARGAGLLPEGFDDAAVRRHRAVFEANLRAYLAHRPRAFDGPTVLLNGDASEHADASAWAPWVGTHETVVVPGTHQGVDGVLGSRRVAALARALEAAIARAEAEPGT